MGWDGYGNLSSVIQRTFVSVCFCSTVIGEELLQSESELASGGGHLSDE